jgi:DNA topoisomerase-2
MATKITKAIKSRPSTSTSVETKPEKPKKSLKKLTTLNPDATCEEIENTIVQEMSAMSMSASATDLVKYQKMSDKEHILKKPDTYIGPIDMTETETYVYDAATSSIVQRSIAYIPGLYKLFDEGAVNSRDHYVRQAQAIADGKPNALPVTYIDFDISEDGIISITNNGNGIDVAQHPEHKLWIPEMIFGHLRTSTNYDENKKEKIVGGKNGFGFKLVLIWSTWGCVETIDHTRGLKYIQEFKNNLEEICPPKITKSTAKPYTKVSFRPDYARFGLENSTLTPDMRALFEKRIYDIAAITDKSVKVRYNGNEVAVKHFQQYIDLYIGAKGETKRIYESPEPRWEYVVALSSSGEFQHVSFVNGIYTQKGGKHVEYIVNQIVRKLTEFIKTKKKIDVKATTIKEQLALFLRCDIENPSFSSQSKDELGTASSAFGSTCKVSDEFIEKLAKMGVMDAACELTAVKENKAAKKTDGSKTRTIRGIPKLIDANFAGTEKSGQCTIILCEGDSAKAGIISGLSREDRNTIGVYPMKGKIMNTRGEPIKKISENNEIKEIKQILGLEVGRKYTTDDVKYRLRYGKIIFMTDQDLDGSHIKGLGINLFQSEWPSLAEIPGFIGFMNTPILKAKKGTQEKVFYNEGEYRAWKEGTAETPAANTTGWNVKYYKGLGTSTGKEFKEYFEHKKIVDFVHSGDVCNDAIDMVFNKKRADDRKTWLSTYSRDRYLDTLQPSVTYEKFIHDEMIHFSKYDCDRSIPNGMDGLKISLRKILFSAFKKNLKTEIKVAQFSGYVSEHSGYHHGEASLNAAIVGMAQNFVGSNNINLFEPNGQFGTRNNSGRDSASERYIFTQLNKITRFIFRAEDDAVLTYLDDDGQSVEPIFYVPIIPMVLVNGVKGIGTGFSTDIMCYNPQQIIDYLKYKLTPAPASGPAHGPAPTINPYYKNFKGTIERIGNGNTDDSASTSTPAKYLIKGCYTILDDKKIHITELPVGTWTEDYKKFIEQLIEPVAKKSSDAAGSASTSASAAATIQLVKDYNDMSTDTIVDITLTMMPNIIATYRDKIVEHGCTMLEKCLGLYTTQSTTNMNMFDANEKLKKYNTPEEIVDDYYPVRIEYYQKRKAYLLDALRKELLVLSNRARYISEILDDTIDLRRKTTAMMVQILKDRKYDVQQGDDGKDSKDGSDSGTGYKYLLKLPMDSVSEENVEKLRSEKEKKEQELVQLESKTTENLWQDDLEELEEEYKKFIERSSGEEGTKAKSEDGASVKKSKPTPKLKKTLAPIATQ